MTTTNAPANGSAASPNGSKPNEDKLLEPGVRKARPVEGVMTHTTSNKPQFAVRFQILDGPDAGKHVTWWGGFEGQGFKYTTDAMALMGWDRKTNPSAFKPSKDVIVVLEHHTIPASPTKPARKVTRVKYVNAIDGSGGNGLEKLRLKPEEAKAAGDAILARMMAEGASQGDAGTPMGQADPNQFDPGAPEGGQDDELPF